MRRYFFCLVFAWFLVIAPLARADAPSRAKLGTKIPNLTFTDASGKRLALHDLKDQKAIALVFLSFECPVSNDYCQPLADMQREYGKHSVAFIGLTVNEDETQAQVAKQAKEFNLNFPVFLDKNLTAAHALEANFTPEVFVLDGDFTLRYRGRIDNSYSERLKKHPQVTRHDLKQVIGEILSGRPVAEPATLAVGCAIVREERQAGKEGPVTYTKDVLPILQNHCQSCHRPGESGPFSLMNYRQAVNWASDIKTFTRSRQMPPWKPASGLAMHNDRRLTDKQIATLAAWVDGGTPEGNSSDAPPARVFTQGWQLGTPDLILTPKDDFVLGPNGRDLFRCFVLPTNVPNDTYVTAVEVRPSNPRVVHHALLFIDATGAARKLEVAERTKKPKADDPLHPQEKANPDWDKGPGYTVAMGVGFIPQGGLSGWAPGIQPRYLPDNAGYFLPKGADVVLQVHYHRNGRVEKDRTQIGLYLAKKPVDVPFGGGVVAGQGSGIGPLRLFFSIPAGDPGFKLSGNAYAQKDFTLHSVSPHMHMLGKSIQLTMTPPEGPPQTLVSIPTWDYNWQEIYFFKEPVRVKAGTKFQVDAVFDNSDKNPMNPFSPPRALRSGNRLSTRCASSFWAARHESPPSSGGAGVCQWRRRRRSSRSSRPRP